MVPVIHSHLLSQHQQMNKEIKVPKHEASCVFFVVGRFSSSIEQLVIADIAVFGDSATHKWLFVFCREGVIIWQYFVAPDSIIHWPFTFKTVTVTTQMCSHSFDKCFSDVVLLGTVPLGLMTSVFLTTTTLFFFTFCFWSQKVKRRSLDEDTGAMDRKTLSDRIKNNSSTKRNQAYISYMPFEFAV